MPPREHGTVHTGVGLPPPRVIPPDDDLRARRRDPQRGDEGRDAGRARARSHAARRGRRRSADVLGAGVAKALLGKAVLPDDLPCVTGSIGLLGTKPSWELMSECDTLLMVGSSFPYSEFLPKEGQARGVQIDLRRAGTGLRYPMEVNLIGRQRGHAARRSALPEAQDRPELAQADRGERGRLVEGARGARHERRAPDQPAAGLLGAVEAAAGQRHPHQRLGLLGQLVSRATSRSGAA